MKKIPTLYVRDWTTHEITDEVTPGCEWVLRGEGRPTRKYDGTCMMLDSDGKWWARRIVKPHKTPPPNFQALEIDWITGNTIGWEPVAQSPWFKAFTDTLEHNEYFWDEVLVLEGEFSDVGTYELCGPKVNGNPDGYDHHVMIRHDRVETIAAAESLIDDPKNLVRWANAVLGAEGVVWHHPDGRRAKLKYKDVRRSRP
jgi:hypothetical protein